MKRFTVYMVALIVAVLMPIGVGAKSSPAFHVPCDTAARVGYFSYVPPGPAQTYQVSFTVQGVGLVRLHESPVYHNTDTVVDSQGAPTDYSYQKTIDRYPGRPTELFLDGNAAPCTQYPNGLTVTNVVITTVPVRVRPKTNH